MKLLYIMAGIFILFFGFALLYERAAENTSEWEANNLEESEEFPETDQGKFDYYVTHTRASISSLKSNVESLKKKVEEGDYEDVNLILNETLLSFESLGYMLPYDISDNFIGTDEKSEEIRELLWSIPDKFENSATIENEEDMQIIKNILHLLNKQSMDLADIFEDEYNTFFE